MVSMKVLLQRGMLLDGVSIYIDVLQAAPELLTFFMFFMILFSYSYYRSNQTRIDKVNGGALHLLRRLTFLIFFVFCVT